MKHSSQASGSQRLPPWRPTRNFPLASLKLSCGSRMETDRPIWGPQVEMAGYVLPDVALPEEGRSVVAVIDKITDLVVKIIREFQLTTTNPAP